MKSRKLPARIARRSGAAFASLSLCAACAEWAEPTLFVDEANALCRSDAGCGEVEGPAPDAGWLSRCTRGAECASGECVCGLCTAACSNESRVCSGVPDAASCFGPGSIARAALCHATTVAGICLLACSSSDECGAGFSCALGACLPKPPGQPQASPESLTRPGAAP